MKKTNERVSLENWAVNDELLSLKISAAWKSFKSEHFAFMAICFYLFFDYVKPDQQYPIFAILPFLFLSILGAIVGWYMDPTSKIQFSALHTVLLLFGFHAILSSLFAYDSAFAFAHFELLRTSILIIFLITAIVKTEKRLFIFFLVYFVSNFRMSQFGFISWVKRGFSFASYGVTGAGWFRNSGEFGMEMAIFFAFTICFVFFLKGHWKGWMKWLMYFLPLSAIGCVLASSSRGAILAAIGGLLYLSMFSKQKFKAIIGASIVLGVAYWFIPPEFLERFQTAGTDKTSLSRIYYWGKARAMIADHPVFGVGYYNWIPYFRDHYYDPKFSGNVELCHNTFLQLGAELGYVGLGYFILLCLMSFWMNWKTERLCRRPGFEFLRSFAMGMNAAGVAMILASNFLTATYIPCFWTHFAFTICVSQIARKKIELLGEDDNKEIVKKGRKKTLAIRASNTVGGA